MPQWWWSPSFPPSVFSVAGAIRPSVKSKKQLVKWNFFSFVSFFLHCNVQWMSCGIYAQTQTTINTKIIWIYFIEANIRQQQIVSTYFLQQQKMKKYFENWNTCKRKTKKQDKWYGFTFTFNSNRGKRQEHRREGFLCFLFMFYHIYFSFCFFSNMV